MPSTNPVERPISNLRSHSFINNPDGSRCMRLQGAQPDGASVVFCFLYRGPEDQQRLQAARDRSLNLGLIVHGTCSHCDSPRIHRFL